MSRDAFHPETLIAHSGLFDGAVLKHVEALLAKVYPFKNDRHMTVSDLCRISDEQILSAIKKPGIRIDDRDRVLHYVHTARKFSEPLGTRFPIRPEMMEGYEEDGDFDDRPPFVSRGMNFTAEQIRHLEKLLSSDNSSLSRDILKAHSKCFEDVRKDANVTLHLNRPVIHWEEKDNGYELRIKKHYYVHASPTVDVIRRWDSVIQGVVVSIIRSAKRPGVGAYHVLVNTDTNPEPLIYDRCTFMDAENALINKLNLRPTGLDAPDPALNTPQEKT